MRTYEHQPPTYEAIPETDLVDFLAGPIQGAPDWQANAVGLLTTLNADQPLHIANPRRDVIAKEDFNYDEQVGWELHHLERAAANGAVIFWFAARDYEQEYDETRSYAQTTRVEFGLVFGWMKYKPDIHVSIGIEPGYKGSEKYFNYHARKNYIPVFSTLEDVCVEAKRGK